MLARIAPRQAVEFGNLKALLEHCGAFAGTRSIDQLAQCATVKLYKRDTVIFRQGDAWPFLGVVCDGAISMIATTPAGREQVIYEAHARETFGDIPLLDGGTNLARAVVVTPQARIAAIPRSACLDALASDPDLARAFSLTCARRTRLLADRLAAQISQPTIARIAAALLPYAAPGSGLLPANPQVAAFRHAHIAAMAGTVKEVVARAVTELETAGALARQRGRIVMLDRERLSAYLPDAAKAS